jgi:hypothetical protein
LCCITSKGKKLLKYNNQTIGEAKIAQDLLYYLHILPLSETNDTLYYTHSNTPVSPDTIHKRLGHIITQRIKRMHESKAVKGLNMIGITENSIWNSRQIAKSKKGNHKIE